MDLKEVRKKLKLTQKEVAQEMKITRETYLKLENRTKSPTVQELNQLSKILKVTPKQLLGYFSQKEV